MDSNSHTNPKKEAMLKALEESLGVVTMAAKKIGIDRRTHYLWMNTDEDYKAAVEDLQDVVLDFAESRLHKLVEKGDTASTIFLLKTKGKRRGYIERTDHDLTTGGQPISITLDLK
jgi:hypothetical protein